MARLCRDVLSALKEGDDARACELLRSGSQQPSSTMADLKRAAAAKHLLHRAVAYHCDGALEFLLAEVKMNPNALDKHKRTPLYLAASENHAEAARILLAHGALVGGTGVLRASLVRH